MSSNMMLVRDIYTFNRLVFVNSCGHAYTELQLDKNVVMTGSNNVGKTSSLSALKLFILPEVNFKDCSAKFDFKSGGQKFGPLDSFQYYFPCNESFIILDVENPHGQFCVILSRGSGELSYSRTFVAQPYEEIKHSFWQFEEGGVGARVEELSRQSVKEALEIYSPVFVSDVDTIKSTIYQENAIDPRLGRFCLVPLPDGGSPQEIRALRSLIMMAFDSSQAKGESLPEAVATIIEGERRSAKEKMNVSFNEIIAEYNLLNHESERLVKLEENLHYWQQAGVANRDYRVGLAKTAQMLANLRAGISGIREQIEAEKGAKDQELNQRQAAYSEIALSSDAAEKEYRQAKGELKQLSKQYNDLKSKVESVDKVRKEYLGLDDEEIIDILTEFVQERETGISGLESTQALAEKWDQLTAERISANQERDRLKAQLASLESATLSGLSAHAASTLKSLNSHLAGCRASLSTDQGDIVHSFADLFAVEEGRLVWLGEPLSGTPFIEYDPKSETDKLTTQLDGLESRLRKTNNQLTTLHENSSLKKEDQALKIAEYKREIEKANLDIRLIKAYEQNVAELPQKGVEYQEKETAVELSANKAETFKEELETAQGRVREIKALVDDLNRRLIDLTEHNQYVDRYALGSVEGFYAMVDQLGPNPVAETGLEAAIDTFAKASVKVQEHHSELIRLIRMLVRKGLIEGIQIEEADRDDLSINDARTLYERLSADFANLDELKKNHRENVLAHNKLTNITISELKANQASIKAFESEINKEFEGCHISDLTDIKIRVEVDQRFVDLLKKIDKRSANALGSATLASSAFYEDLASFVRDYFTQKRQRDTLNLHNVIREVTFSYKKGGMTESKAQSTGTTNMFVAVLLSILMQRIIPGGTELHMPLVMDEVADLDAENLKTLLGVLSQQHFRLFSATPEISGLLAKLIGRWVEIGTLRVPNPMAPECTCIWMDDSNALLMSA